MGEQGGDVLPFEVINQPHHHAVDFIERGADETRQWIHNHDRRFRVVNLAMHRREVKFETVQRRTGGMDPEQVPS